MPDTPDFAAAHADILHTYDQKSDDWHPWELGIDLRRLWANVRNGGAAPSVELEADLAAFEFQLDYDEERHTADLGPKSSLTTRDGVRHEIPDVSALSEAHLEVWKVRTCSVTSPLLKTRYADVTWEYSKNISGVKVDRTFGTIAVKSTLEWIQRGKLDAFEARLVLARAFKVASQVENVELANELTRVTLSLDAAEPVGGHVGLAFDLLVAPRRIDSADPSCDAIISKLESQLTFYAPDGAQRADAFRAELASERLIRFYARTGREHDRRRTIARVANAFLVEAAASAGIRGTFLATRAEEMLRGGGLSAEASAAAAKVREFSKRIPAELDKHELSVSIPRDVVNRIVDPLTKVDLATGCAMTARHFVPSRMQTEDLVARLEQESPLLYLVGHDVVDDQGRPTAHVGSREGDAEGHVIRQVTQTIQIEAFLVALSIKRLASREGFTVEALLGVVSACPLIEASRLDLLRRGVESHLVGNYVESVHVLLPQIEQILRTLVEEEGGVVLRANRSGGFDYRVLDDLLRDEIVRVAFGEDCQTYLRALLSDRRGWNVRNVVLHGLAPAEFFHEVVSARVIHALLVVASIRREPAEPST